MTTPKDNVVTPDNWGSLKEFTDARISLGRCGSSLPLRESLSFKLAHAQARDAVHTPFAIGELRDNLTNAGYACLELSSKAQDRIDYLARPDKGRTLNETSLTAFEGLKVGYDICIVVTDGLSSRAIHENAYEFLTMFLPLAKQANISVAPISLLKNGRVAIADEIGHRLQAKLSIILVGERPGLSSPNSMGIYLTYNAQPGTTDEARNCISNIREAGMPLKDGVTKLAYLVEMALTSKQSGVGLKDKMTSSYLPFKGHDLQLTD